MASGKIDEVAKSAEHAKREMRGVTESLKLLGEAFLVDKIWDKGKEALIGYNSQLEQSKVQIAGMLSMYTDVGIDKAFDRAAISVERFQQMAKKSSLTTKELVETSSGLVRPLLMAGLNMSEIEKMSFGMANTAKAFGINGGFASLEVEEALTTGVHQRNRFVRNLISQSAIHMSTGEFNAMDIHGRAATLNKALTTKAVTDMARKHGEETLSGLMSTLRDNMEITLGKIGLPLFEAIKQQIKEWNHWIDLNGQKLDEIGRNVGQTLVTGFRYVKDVFSFIYDHSGTLLEVAKVWAAMKIGGTLLGGLGGSAGGLGGTLGGLREFFKMPTAARDGFAMTDDEVNGSYFYHPGSPGGRAFQGVGGISGLMEFAPMLMQIGTASYELTSIIMKESGARDALLSIIDPQKEKLKEVTDSLAKFDEGLRRTSEHFKDKKGAEGTQYFATVEHGLEYTKNRLKYLKLAQAELAKGAMHGTRAGDLLATGDYDSDTISRLLAHPEQLKEQIRKNADIVDRQSHLIPRAEHITDKGVAMVFAKLPNDVKAQLDQQKVTNNVMGQVLRALEDHKPITLKDIKNWILAKDPNDPDSQFKSQAIINQEVHITIERVMAKDPNRWLADMDDQINRRTRARTRAKGAWKNTPY